jgi:hypothetical protein
MNTGNPISTQQPATAHRVEFFRLPPPGKRDPFFGLSRGWYYKAAAAGEIKMVAIRNRGAVRGVRLVAYDSVVDYVRRCMGAVKSQGHSAVDQMGLFAPAALVGQNCPPINMDDRA